MFWNQLESILTGASEGEKLIVAGDLNGHVGMDGEGIERWHGKLMIGMKNEEGERVLEMAQTYDLALLNIRLCKERRAPDYMQEWRK